MTPTDAELKILCHLNHAEWGPELTRWSGPAGEIHEAGGVLCFASASTFPVLMNGVVRLDPRVDADQVLDTADAWFSARGRGYTLIASQEEPDLVPRPMPREMPPLAGQPPELVCTTIPDERPAPDGIELRWVTDEEGMRTSAEVNGDAYSTYGMPRHILGEPLIDAERFCAPHVATVLAYEGDHAVATAELIMSHGIGGIYAVGTCESARGKGLGDLVSRVVTRRGFELGAPAVVLQASPMGEPIYLRQGYRELYRYTYPVRLTPV